MKVFIVGYMYSGKTTVGKKLASRLKYKFIDTDMAFMEKFKISVVDFFSKYDENLFRKLEHELLKEILITKNVIISTGGGTPCFYDNMSLIKNHGISMYLKMSLESILYRMKESKKKRPVLQKLEKGKLKNFIKNQLSEREKYYNQADYVVKGENADIKMILKLISNHLF